MTPAIVATTILSLLAVAAMLYALHLHAENARLRAAIVYYIELIKDLILEDE